MRRWLLLALLVPRAAAAVEGESALSVSVKFATLNVVREREADVSAVGGALVVDYQRGIGDTFWLRGAAGGAVHDADGGAVYAGHATAGITYAVDVLKYVPYLGIGAGALVIGGGPLETGVRPYIELGAGVEVLESPTFSWGADARLSSFISGVTVFMVGPRVSWRWGYF